MDMTEFHRFLEESEDLAGQILELIQNHLKANPDFKFSAVIPGPLFAAAILTARQIKTVPLTPWDAVSNYNKSAALALKIAFEQAGYHMTGICRKCGCTDQNPCQGPGGPCWWVQEDLCCYCTDEPTEAAEQEAAA